MNEYKVKFYQDDKENLPVLNYIEKSTKKEKAKIFKYIEFLKENDGYLDEPYSRHIKGKIRELRVDFNKNKHIIFYFTFIKRTIVLLHAFLKKTPIKEIRKAEKNYKNVKDKPKIYE